MTRILVVDDDRALLDALPRMLRVRLPDVAVDTCDSAALAVEQIRGIDYDAVVTDVKMPGIDGLALLSVIRRLRPQTPTLLITGHGDDDLAVQALRGGAYDFIQKPIDRDYLVASLKRALEKSDLRRQLAAHHTAVEERAAALEQAVDERTRELLQANRAKDQLLAERERALAEARAVQGRLAFLAAASNLLGSLDYERSMERVARLAVTVLGDSCVLTIEQTEHLPKTTAVAASSATLTDELRSLVDGYPDTDLAAEVFAELGGTAAGVTIDLEGATTASVNQRALEFLRALGRRASMIVPIELYGRRLGTLACGAGDLDRRYESDDLALAQDLARRCALAFENARLYVESERVREQLRRANEAKDEFLALISHEMRTPLTTVFGSAQLLHSRLGQLAPETQDALLNSLVSESARLRRIVEDLLVLARIEMGAPVASAPVSLDHSVQSVVDAFRHMQPERTIEVHLPPDLISLAADETYVEQVLHNLVSNADKYSPGQYPIEIRATRDGAAVRVSVLDRGAGVAPHEVDLIFERFYRSERSSAPGVGMGLTVCRRLIEALSGRIWAAPRAGGGLEVTFTLPVWQAADAAPPSGAAEPRPLEDAPSRAAHSS